MSVCDKCGKIFRSPGQLATHCSRDHVIDEALKLIKEKLQSPLTPQEIFEVFVRTVEGGIAIGRKQALAEVKELLADRDCWMEHGGTTKVGVMELGWRIKQLEGT